MNQTVKIAKQLSWALFFIFLCTAPLFAFGQDAGRLIDIPDILNNPEGSQEIRDAVESYGHTVFNEDDIEYIARKNNKPADYWKDPSQIPEINLKARHDAFIKLSRETDHKTQSLVITIYNANTAEVIDELERVLKKKKVTQEDVNIIARAIDSIVQDIPPFEYPPDAEITITSTPTGATVYRDGKEIGTTPLKYTVTPDPDVTEQWTLSYPGREPVLQAVSFAKSSVYDVKIPEPVVESKPHGKLSNGTGRPIFQIGFNISPSIHNYNFTDNATTPPRLNMTHQSSAFPIYSFDVYFFPFPLFTDIDYLQGLGIQSRISFGFLETNIATQEINAITKCKQSSDNSFKCETTYLRFNIDLIYRLLLQKKGGNLNPNGLALDFLFGFNMIDYDLQDNPYYLGNDYKGLHLGTAFSTPLGISQLRLKADLGFYINLGHDDVKKFSKLGTARDYSWGMDLALLLMYDIWKGIYIQAGYDFKYINSRYSGTGAVKLSERSYMNPKDAVIKDMYHEIILGLGYMFY